MSPTPPKESPSVRSDDKSFNDIVPASGWHILDLKEIWRRRELLWIMGLRDNKVRYKETVIGVAWAVIQPFTIMVLMTAFFRLLGQTPSSGDVPYPALIFCGLLHWQFFASSVTQGSGSLVMYQNMIKKIYFPRALLPASALEPVIRLHLESRARTALVR